jgi:hypothetical protein
MVATSSFGGTVAWIVPAGTGGLHGALDPPSSGWPGADGIESCPTRTKGVGSDEPAVAPHKIAVIFYTMVKNQVEYDESIWATRDAHTEKRLEMKLKRQAKQSNTRLHNELDHRESFLESTQ